MTINLFCKAKPVILVVDDNPDHWLLIRWALLERFAEVDPVWVANREEAMAHLATTKNLPRLILLDLYLPTRQIGWSLLEIIKSHDQYKNIPIVTLSSSDNPADIVQSYQLRVNSYIVKPNSYQEWLSCFAQLTS
jgi:CheY-like chemotaxis protein